MEMPAVLIESNPLVEETRNQVAVKRGPIVYCLESADLPGQKITDIIIPEGIKLIPFNMQIGNGKMKGLSGNAFLLESNEWNNSLYKEINRQKKPIKVKLIPYYAWANRGNTDMTVWMPVSR